MKDRKGISLIAFGVIIGLYILTTDFGGQIRFGDAIIEYDALTTIAGIEIKQYIYFDFNILPTGTPTSSQ